LTLIISGVGITNNSGTTQKFVTGVDGTGNFGQIVLRNSAAAGDSTIFINNGSAANFVQGGETAFFNTSTAANGTFVNKGGHNLNLRLSRRQNSVLRFVNCCQCEFH
jgi:hypothetical protein